METKGEILVADDERTLLVTLAIMLEDAGYSVRTAKDGEAALKSYREKRPDLVLLDVMMPKMDGFAVCREIRKRDEETPILFLTSLGDEKSQLEGFGCGADDYILKTLPESLFLARVAAAVRRTNVAGRFGFGSWSVSAGDLCMRRDGETSPLSDRELALLRLFATHADEVLDREFLLAQGWGGDTQVTDGVLSVLMSGLREKLRDDGRKIVTVRGVGYVYRP